MGERVTAVTDQSRRSPWLELWFPIQEFHWLFNILGPLFPYDSGCLWRCVNVWGGGGGGGGRGWGYDPHEFLKQFWIKSLEVLFVLGLVHGRGTGVLFGML